MYIFIFMWLTGLWDLDDFSSLWYLNDLLSSWYFQQKTPQDQFVCAWSLVHVHTCMYVHVRIQMYMMYSCIYDSLRS